MAKTNRQLFRPLDILFPISVLVLIAGACFLIAWFAKTDLAGRLVTAAAGVTALGFIALFYWTRYAKTQHDYKTSHGVYIVLGKKNRPSQKDVEQWTESTIIHWSTCNIQKPNGELLTREDVLEAVKNLRCFFNDAYIVTRFYAWLRGIPREVRALGYAYNDKLVVGYTKDLDKHEWQVYRHELSHPILTLNGFPPGHLGDKHHVIFKQTKLGA